MSKAKNNQSVKISRREHRLRERLLAVDEDLAIDEKHLRDRSEALTNKLTKKINKARLRQERRLDRREASKLYSKLPVLYYLLTPIYILARLVRRFYRFLLRKVEHHSLVTPHRTFYLTTRAKSVRQINITGYFKFCGQVWHFIWQHKKFFLITVVIVTLALLTIIGLNERINYVEMRNTIENIDEVRLDPFSMYAGLMTQAIISAVSITDMNRRVVSVVIFIFIWLTLIYAIRHLYGGAKKMKFRDALYNSGAPFIPVLMLIVLIGIQILPLSIGMLIYTSTSGAGYINSGIQIENLAALAALGLLFIMTLYWVLVSLMSFVTVTIPGIYPSRAYFETSVLLSGRRIKVFWRILVMILVTIAMWLVLLTPFILIDMWLKFQFFPFVQIGTTLLVALTMVWSASYLYMLYRRLIDSPEQPYGTGQIVWPWQIIANKWRAFRKRKAKAKNSRQTKK